MYIYICCWNVRCFNVSVTRDFVRGAQLRIAKARHARLDHVVNPTMNHTQFIPVQQFGVYHELTKLHAGLFVYVLSETELRNRLVFPPTSIGDQRYIFDIAHRNILELSLERVWISKLFWWLARRKSTGQRIIGLSLHVSGLFCLISPSNCFHFLLDLQMYQLKKRASSLI